jgi:hypothetical protein
LSWHRAMVNQRAGTFRQRTLRVHVLFSIWLLAMLTILVGCQTERVTTSDGRPMPRKPTAAPRTPDDAQVNRMAFMVSSKPEDTSGNGYPDLILVTVALFSLPHPISIHADGVFEFALYERGRARDPNAAPLAEWRMEGEAVRQAHAVAGYGPCYQFGLSLHDAGGDVFPLTSADLRCTFHPADGSPPVQSDGVRSIQIGSRLAGR